MPGSTYFEEKKKKSLNSFINGDNVDSWEPDYKYIEELRQSLERVQSDLDTGILTKYRVLRQQQLEKLAIKNCYANRSFTVMEAEACEDFHFKNDYKMNLISSFWKDHIPKHLNAYEGCFSKEIQALGSVGEKDKAFADCHKAWIKDFRNNKSQELEIRARQLFGKSLEPVATPAAEEE